MMQIWKNGGGDGPGGSAGVEATDERGKKDFKKSC